MEKLSEEGKDSPDWLPGDWILEIRTQQTGAYAGRQIKCYYDPSTGSRFYSKKAVFRYLNAGNVFGPTMRQTRSITAKSVSECCSETNQEESMKNSTNNAFDENFPSGLPKGWTKETRVRKVDRRKKDPFYIDPVSGYEFRSLKDVSRYIETGDILQCAVRPRKRGDSGTCTIVKESQSPTAAKKRDRRGDSVKKCLFTSKGSDTDVKKAIEIYKSSESSSPPHRDHASTKSEEDNLNCKIPNIKILDNKNQDGLKLVSTGFTSILEKENICCLTNDAAETREEVLQTEQPYLNGECFPSAVNVNFIDSETLLKVKESSPSPNALLGDANLMLQKTQPSEHKNDEPSDLKKPKRGRKKKVGAITMPVRASKRLAALRDNTSNETEMSEGNCVTSEMDKALSSSTLSPVIHITSNGYKMAEGKFVASEMDEALSSSTLSPVIHITSNGYKMAEGNSVASEMDNALGSSTISPLIDAKSCAVKSDYPGNLKNLETLSTEDCSHKQVPVGTVNNDKREPQFESPFGDSWPDPCIEFAFKTLTSDIPFLDDLTTMQLYVQQQQMGSTLGPSLDHSIGSGNQGSLNQKEHLNEHLTQLNLWNDPFVPFTDGMNGRVPFTDDMRPRPFEQGFQSRKKVN